MNVEAGAERRRLDEARGGVAWRKWGPYLSERQWGTVREDYSESGDAWNYLTHDQSRSRAYRWGEDGLAGISDDRQLLCFALALWNERDPILKERLFGLTNSQGVHGEDVKEYYFYLDNTPTHSYMRELYKYPQAPFPYEDLVSTNGSRNKRDFEYELLDTGIFDDDRYFDVFIDYAKAGPDDLLIEITAFNRGPDAAPLHILPTLWFRNTWDVYNAPRPAMRRVDGPPDIATVNAQHSILGNMHLFAEGEASLLFTENDTNNERLFGGNNRTPYVKDGINEFVVAGKMGAVNPEGFGTKAAAHYRFDIPAGESATVRLRLTAAPLHEIGEPFGAYFNGNMEERRREADEFYASVTPAGTSADAAQVLRQAIAGLLWSKQYYGYDLNRWLVEHQAHPRAPMRSSRNSEWFHMVNEDIISMPDKWEYPWFAAWDLAFHTIPLSTVDVEFAQSQLDLMLRADYLHPNGQLPAYEWNFSDVNPPVHAWASLFAYETEKRQTGYSDIDFLKRIFQKLLTNFTWWVNRKDRFGRNVFEGGFLGLDNIGVFDRSAPLPTGGYLEQADGTAWMAMFTQNMLSMAIELAAHDPVFDDMAPKFADHFILIASAINRMGGTDRGLWDDEDGFYYDVLRRPDGSATPLKVRSVVGLLPFCASVVIEEYQRDRMPHLMAHIHERRKQIEEMGQTPDLGQLGPGYAGRTLVSLVSREKLERILKYMLDENEFLSPHGIRSLSRFHAEHPYTFNVDGVDYGVGYLPAESDSGMFGGNSNWRGPVWFPINALIIRALMQSYLYYGNDFQVECPTGSGRMMNLYEVAEELARRLTSIFVRDEDGKRPVYGGIKRFQEDPHWRDHILFYEYFHGDNGAGLGASHQTGWTGLVASAIQLFGNMNPTEFLESGKVPLLAKREHEEAGMVGG
jgi:hypothetical protein